MELEHRCGVMGFNYMLGDKCPKCEAERPIIEAAAKQIALDVDAEIMRDIDAETLYDMLRVDPNEDTLYASTMFLMDIDEIGSNYMSDFNEAEKTEKTEEGGLLVEETLMSEDEFSNLFDNGELYGDPVEVDEEMPDLGDSISKFDEDYTVKTFLMNLENFLDEELEGLSRGNVFLSQNGDGVTVNLLVGTPFAFVDEEINQVNIIIAPTDRALLGSKEVSMDDRIDTEDEEFKSTHDAFDDAMDIL